jgi:hypothetical protein
VEENNTLTKTTIPDNLAPQKVSPYELLMRQSIKMGKAATHTLDVTKQFLKQDVSTLHPDKLLFGHTDSSTDSNTHSNESSHQDQSRDSDSQNSQKSSHQSNSDSSKSDDIERENKTLDPAEGLKRIVRKSHQLLASAQTVILPINLFPDSVTVDRTKVTITKRTFFWSSSVISIRIEDVLNIACSTGPIFGSLTISSRVMNSTDHYEIDYFWRKDALYLKQIIQGYVIAQHNQIETTHLNRRELIQTLLDLGNDTDY